MAFEPDVDGAAAMAHASPWPVPATPARLATPPAEEVTAGSSCQVPLPSTAAAPLFPTA